MMCYQEHLCFFLLLLLGVSVCFIYGQHEDIPYQNVEQICKTCRCYTTQDADRRYHYAMNCANKSFEHILARWPNEFGKDHTNTEIVATFSWNNISVLQQLPATNSTLTFTCSGCGIRYLQSPTFMDVPYIRRLDLSWNGITTEELTPDVFRGPFRATSYEPIALKELDLSHNQLHALDKRQFEHTPNLTKLYLSHNELKSLDMSTELALASARQLDTLDLSYTGINSFPDLIAKSLSSLRELNLAGNAFIAVPDSLQLLAGSLQWLNLAGNSWGRLSEQSFKSLRALRRLNISGNHFLNAIEANTFSGLAALEQLDCTHNPQLHAFPLDSLKQCSNLTFLDISHCALSTLPLDMDLSALAASNNETSNVTAPPPPQIWPRLASFEFDYNPWHCDCDLLLTLQYIKLDQQVRLQLLGEARCETPYILAGARISNLTALKMCSSPTVRELHVIDEDPPRFLRKDYIILTSIVASVVILVGFIIGFLVVCIRRRLKRDDYGAEPIRYTSVRSSNFSAQFPAATATTAASNGNGHLNAGSSVVA